MSPEEAIQALKRTGPPASDGLTAAPQAGLDVDALMGNTPVLEGGNALRSPDGKPQNMQELRDWITSTEAKRRAEPLSSRLNSSAVEMMLGLGGSPGLGHAISAGPGLPIAGKALKGWDKISEAISNANAFTHDQWLKQLDKTNLLNGSVTEEALANIANDATLNYALATKDFKQKLGDKGFPVPEAVRALRSQQLGYTQPAFRGVGKEPRRSPNYDQYDEYSYFSTPNPKLAELYADAHERPQIQPLLLKTDDYHSVDAGGRSWSEVNSRAISEAIERKKKGVIVRNVWDEPSGSGGSYGRGKLDSPNTVYISLDPSTVRSKFAKFDPAKANLNDLLASGSAVAVAGGTAHQILKDVDGNLHAIPGETK